MKLATHLTLIGLLASSLPATAQACGGHRGRCGGHHRHSPVITVACAPTPLMMASSPQPYPMTAGTQPVTSTPVPAQALTNTTVQPTYDYAPSAPGQPAYYYTYDNSGQLIIAQWMDWVFRGGRAAGEPAPPLPIIGALRNR